MLFFAEHKLVRFLAAIYILIVSSPSFMAMGLDPVQCSIVFKKHHINKCCSLIDGNDIQNPKYNIDDNIIPKEPFQL
jgi:hypothetical protein